MIAKTFDSGRGRVIRTSTNCVMQRWVSVLALAIAAAIASPPTLGNNDDDCGSRGTSVKGPKVKVMGLTTDQRLVSFRECKPGWTQDVGFVRGLQAPDSALVGIDFRVQDGQLYGVGNGGGIYTIDVDSAMAAKVSQLTVSLDGTSFGVDFNPAADRLRIVSNTGQNLRHNVNAGGTTLTDLPLNYMTGVTATGVAGAAYTNNDLDPNSGTTLFDIDATLNQVVVQSPPNDGRLVATGKLVVDPDGPVGFDIYTRLSNGVATTNQGFASLVAEGANGFYRINLLTGGASLIGTFSSDSVVDIAIPLQQEDDD
jgi:hypothetical protein